MQPTSQLTSANRQVARASLIIMFTFAFSKVISLVSTLLLARAFNVNELDAFNAANTFPDILFNLVAGGALASAFVPTFTALVTVDDRGTAWRLASSILNLVLLVLTSIALLSAIFAPWVIAHLIAPGFQEPAKLAVTANLMRIQLIATVIFGVSGLAMGILNAHQIFLFPALAPAMYPLGTIFGVLFLAPHFGIYGAAWGMVLGALMHLLLQLPSLVHLPQRRYLPGIGLNDPVVRKVILLMGPRMVGVAAVQMNLWFNRLLASGLPEGSLTAIWYGFGLMMMPEAAIAQSIAIASLPTFSAQVARERPEEMRASLASTLRAVLLLAVPSSVGLILLRRPLVQMLYPSLSTDMVAWALLWYAAGLVGHSVVEITSRAFYALHDTRTPVTVGVVAMSLNIGFSLLFSNWFRAAGLQPHGGLALANSLATGLEMIGLYLLMRRRLNGLHSRSVLRAALAAASGSLGMGIVLWLWVHAFAGMHSALLVGGGILLGGGIYAGVLAALQVSELRRGWGWLAARLRLASRV